MIFEAFSAARSNREEPNLVTVFLIFILVQVSSRLAKTEKKLDFSLKKFSFLKFLYVLS